MRNVFFALTLLCFPANVFAQQPAAKSRPEISPAADNSILIAESANLKSDLAELRSMLNVMASQESTTDYRTHALMQTNRQMWQVIIARLAELTQRLDTLEQQQHGTTKSPVPEPPKKP